MDVFDNTNNRVVPALDNYNEQKHLETITKGDLELYENEYHLIEQSLDLPQKFMELGELEQRMVLLFIDKDYIEPNSGKHTENDTFISFLASYENQSVVKKLYKAETKILGYDKEGNEISEVYKVIDPDSLSLFLKLKRHATMIWKTNNLKEISKSMREIVTNGGYRDNELLEQKIVSDALSNERDSFTMQNRRVAVEIKGMKKPQGLQAINVFLQGGGKESTKAIQDVSKNSAFDLIPEVEIAEDED
jgi:hypothetical protein